MNRKANPPNTKSKQETRPKDTCTIPEAILDFHWQSLSTHLNHWSKTKTVPHTLLFSGLAGIGKRSIIEKLVSWIFCERSVFKQLEAESDGLSLFGESTLVTSQRSDEPSATPCLQCKHCLWLQHHQHVDFHVLAPSESETGKSGSIKLDDLEVIRKNLGFGPKEAPAKIFCIQDAETLTPQASNSLLKILEEPPARWIFILISSRESDLLPTILSRCQRIPLSPIPREKLESALLETVPDFPPDRLRLAIEESQGSFERALRYADNSFWEQRLLILDSIRRPARPLQPLVDWASSHHDCFLSLLDVLDAEGSRLTKLAVQENRDFDLTWKKIERTHQIRSMLSAPLNRKLLSHELLSLWAPSSQ